jgi:alpha-galactosidase
MTRFVSLLICCFFSQAFAQSPFQKVLFLGNSITQHGPKPDIDWSGPWGMAASAKAKDYVHVFTASLAQKQGSTPEILVKNIADFERAHQGYDFAAKLKEAIHFQADLIVLSIGENVRAPKSAEEKAKFQEAVTKLLTTLKGNRQPVILVRSCFWADAAKDEALRGASAAVNGISVNISTLGKNEKNFARSEHPFKHAGVANHPGDAGMAAIAEALFHALPK